MAMISETKKNNKSQVIIMLLLAELILSSVTIASTDYIKQQNKTVLENQAEILYEIHNMDVSQPITYINNNGEKLNTKSDIVSETTTEEITETSTEVTTVTAVAETVSESKSVEEMTTVLEYVPEEDEFMIKYEEYSVPDGDTSFMSYMSYTCITNKNSPQWKLQQKAWTDENGLRRVNDDYCVAVGSYYSTTIGERFLINLDNGSEFTVIIGDGKSDCHTDSTNRYRVCGNNNEYKNVLEFIIDSSQLDSGVRRMGTVSHLDFFNGKIKSIKRIIE